MRPTLCQTAHLLHKQGKYYIVHFKQLFLLDGLEKRTDFSDEDFERLKLIACLLNKWKLVRVKKNLNVDPNTDIVVLSYGEKENWDLKHKYTIGKKAENVN